MLVSIALAKILGPLFLIIAISILLNKRYYQEVYEELLDNPGLVYMGGVLGLILGILMLFFHNFWGRDWSILITMIAWITFIKSILLLFLPETFGTFSRKLMNSSKVLTSAAILWLIIGVYLTLMGFEGVREVLNL